MDPLLTIETTAAFGGGGGVRLLFINGEEQKELQVGPHGFSIGRKSGKDLLIVDPRISRDHADIRSGDHGYELLDHDSRHGTWVNGVRMTGKIALKAGDEIALGAADGPRLVFAPVAGMAQNFLREMSAIEKHGGASDLEKLRVFLELARKLDAPGVLEDVLISLIEATLKLTGAERGYVFLRDDGQLRLAAARNAAGEPLSDDATISHSVIHDALAAATDFFFTDASAQSSAWSRQSIVDQNLRLVLCIPLRERRVREETLQSLVGRPEAAMGVLYLDGHAAARDFSQLNHELLRAIATEAASLVEHARLARTEHETRRWQQELAIAAAIQQRLMPAELPTLGHAEVEASSVACQQVGGDFYDVLSTPAGAYAVLVDVAGKGIAAAILASTLQGMIYSQLLIDTPLAAIAESANQFLCQRVGGEKYATGVLVCLRPDGRLEYVNCGHVPPLIARQGRIERLGEGGFPIGLIPHAQYQTGTLRLEPGDRRVLVTDGVTEVENPEREFYGEERLEQAVAAGASLRDLRLAVDQFRGPAPMGDDCTLLELRCRSL